MINNVDSDETAHDEPSHLYLHCLNQYLLWQKGLNAIRVDRNETYKNISEDTEYISQLQRILARNYTLNSVAA